MANIKACPQCSFISSYDYPIDIEICPRCNYQLEDTGIELYLRPKLERELRKKYREDPRYNIEIERKLLEQRMIDAGYKSPPPTLTTCPVCQGKVSSAAAACPHCGQPMNGGRVAPARPEPTGPKCPHCGCTNIRKIGTFDRLTSIGVWGLASGKIGKQYECWQCKHKW